jgi:hypothetical protein
MLPMTMGKVKIITQTLISANNCALRWSLASSVSSSFVRFWNNLTELQAAAIVSSLVLVIGVVVEYRYELKSLSFLLLKWILRKSTPFDRCVLRKILLHSVGPILVVLGIAGEFVFEGRTFIVEDRQEEQARSTVHSLSVEADAASSKADSAIDKFDTVIKEANAIESRLDAASKELSLLEQSVSEQEPRWKLLEAKKEEFINALKPFAGTKIIVTLCWGKAHLDSGRLRRDIGTFLASVPNGQGARWRTDAREWKTCPTEWGTEGGNMILVSSEASKPVRNAASALYDELNRIGISTLSSDVDPQMDNEYYRNIYGSGSPFELAAKDPASVILMIGVNPMFDIAGWKDRQLSIVKSEILRARKDELEKRRPTALRKLSSERLNKITQDTIKEMMDGEAQIDQANTTIAQNEQDGSTTREDGDRANARVIASVRSKLRDTVLRAYDLRNEILGSDTRLTPAQKKQLADNENDGIFARLRSGDYIYSDLVYARAHLSKLQQALQSNLPHR